MNRYSTIIFTVALMLVAGLAGPALYAQTANPLSAEVKGAYTGIKNNVLKAADKMPEESYGFKATPEVQSFGQRIAHIADSNMRTCAAIKGEQKSVNASAKTTKAELVAALRESFAYCDTIYDSLTDAEAVKLVSTPRGQRSKLAALWGIVAHDNEVYGATGVYMRLKGIVPPSSEGR
ncbi:MAG TPA: DinB family protein [Blastocatellia bacterium]|nr:DinB family protein [Blastocatellia bacterium]